jgi:hypothetical protein
MILFAFAGMRAGPDSLALRATPAKMSSGVLTDQTAG